MSAAPRTALGLAAGVVATVLLVCSNKDLLMHPLLHEHLVGPFQLLALHRIINWIFYRSVHCYSPLATPKIPYYLVIASCLMSNGSIIAGFMTLQQASVAFQQLSRTLSLPLGALLDFFLYGKQRGVLEILFLLAISYGVYMTIRGDVTATYGAINLSLISVTCSVGSAALVGHILKETGMTVSSLALISLPYEVGFSVVVLLICVSPITVHDSTEARATTEETSMLGFLLRLILNGMLAIAVCYLTTWSQGKCSNMLYAGLGQAKSVLTSVIGAIVFHTDMTTLTICGLGVVVANTIGLAASDMNTHDRNVQTRSHWKALALVACMLVVIAIDTTDAKKSWPLLSSSDMPVNAAHGGVHHDRTAKVSSALLCSSPFACGEGWSGPRPTATLNGSSIELQLTGVHLPDTKCPVPAVTPDGVWVFSAAMLRYRHWTRFAVNARLYSSSMQRMLRQQIIPELNHSHQSLLVRHAKVRRTRTTTMISLTVENRSVSDGTFWSLQLFVSLEAKGNALTVLDIRPAYLPQHSSNGSLLLFYPSTPKFPGFRLSSNITQDPADPSYYWGLYLFAFRVQGKDVAPRFDAYVNYNLDKGHVLHWVFPEPGGQFRVILSTRTMPHGRENIYTLYQSTTRDFVDFSHTVPLQVIAHKGREPSSKWFSYPTFLELAPTKILAIFNQDDFGKAKPALVAEVRYADHAQLHARTKTHAHE